jgi:hypothetical protein
MSRGGKNDLMNHIKGKNLNSFRAMSQQQGINGHQYNELCASAFLISYGNNDMLARRSLKETRRWYFF